MKLEVGKTYLNRMGIKVTIVACKEGRYLGITEKATDDGPVFAADGIRKGQYPHDRNKDLIKEYKEPILIERDVVWIKCGFNEPYAVITLKGFPVQKTYQFTELSRETVKYLDPR